MERDSTPQDASIDDVIKATYDACLEFVDKDYKGAKSVGDKPKSGKAKEKPAKTPKLFELLKRQFPGEPEKVGRIMGTLKREDLEKMLVDGKDDDIDLADDSQPERLRSHQLSSAVLVRDQTLQCMKIETFSMPPSTE